MRTDAMKPRQIVINLLGDATKFTTVGQVVLRVRPARETVVFEVADTGIGITPENIERVFDRFSQVDSQYDRQRGGVGLGLAAARGEERCLAC
jgi:signal transduction histidine kinase